MARHRRSGKQLSLPGVSTADSTGGRGSRRKARIPHRKILHELQHGQINGLRGLVEIYQSEVIPVKTRAIRLLGRKAPAKIIHTLLGYEVKSSLKRIHCPDLVTARYIKLFTELGCRGVRLPYDPTVTARVIPEMEASIDRLNNKVRDLFPQKRRVQLYVIRQLYKYIRHQIHSA